MLNFYFETKILKKYTNKSISNLDKIIYLNEEHQF